jgi:membrane fusion protein, multidrug efflux system
MKRLTTTALLLCLTAFGGCSSSDAGASTGKGGPGGPGGPGQEPPAPVTVAEAAQKTVPVELRAFGTVQPNASVDVRSRVSGELIGVHFEKGQDVKTGDLLFTIDSRSARAQKKLAEANLARDKAQHENAESEARRQKELFDSKLVSEAKYAEARTTASALAATVAADEASIQSAALTVDYSEIKSPIDGRTGDLLVNLGNLVTANGAVLVKIKQIRPIRVAFSLPQKDLPAVMQRVNGAAEGEGLEARAFIPGEEDAPEAGRVALVDNAVDPATGTIMVWAEFGNAGSRLWPGQLVNVVLTLSTQDDAITVPTRAVQSGQQGTYVFVARPDATVEQRPITIDRTYGDDSVVSQGLKAGERVVTDGQLRLKPGSRISIRADAPSAASKP